MMKKKNTERNKQTYMRKSLKKLSKKKKIKSGSSCKKKTQVTFLNCLRRFAILFTFPDISKEERKTDQNMDCIKPFVPKLMS